MILIRPSTPQDLPALFVIWKEAVSATHSFLTESDIAFYAEQVRDSYLPSQSFWVAVDSEGHPTGFMGMTGPKIDALFVHPSNHGQGIGRALVDHAASLEAGLLVDVNEQNEGACSFYGKLGFRQIGRSDLDDSGKPFPILKLERLAPANEKGR
ncbi:acetyltransferase [Microvirga rosea]|uniref:acetyltransferase n=1 Tax=Microvirga rosea TaxID=2715425 RepID=UPI001D09D613|nr:acetyltransferase [Microvirga rosea]MCB8821033.1 acetyltransferase [Microvirga rosea]